MGSQLQLTPFITELFLFFLLIFPICACAHIICYIDLFSVQGAKLSQKILFRKIVCGRSVTSGVSNALEMTPIVHLQRSVFGPKQRCMPFFTSNCHM